MQILLGQKVTLTVDFDSDYLGRSWNDTCRKGNNIWLHHAPHFV